MAAWNEGPDWGGTPANRIAEGFNAAAENPASRDEDAKVGMELGATQAMTKLALQNTGERGEKSDKDQSRVPSQGLTPEDRAIGFYGKRNIGAPTPAFAHNNPSAPKAYAPSRPAVHPKATAAAPAAAPVYNGRAAMESAAS